MRSGRLFWTGSALAVALATASAQGPAPQTKGRWELVVLGIAQDAGIPHLKCNQDLCQSIRDGNRKPERVASLGLMNRAVGKAYLFDATPDFVSQLHSLTAGREPDGIFLTFRVWEPTHTEQLGYPIKTKVTSAAVTPQDGGAFDRFGIRVVFAIADDAEIVGRDVLAEVELIVGPDVFVDDRAVRIVDELP